MKPIYNRPTFSLSGLVPDQWPEKRQLLLAAASGLVLTAAFPNFDLSVLAWFALVPLLAAVEPDNTRRNFWIGFIAGLVHNLTLIYWIAYTMRTYGYMPVALCVLVLLLLSSVMALYWAGFATLAGGMPARPILGLVILPAFWAGLEYLRSFFLSGFPWELIGYSQYRNLKFIQIADCLGPFGVSYVIVLVNVSIFMLVRRLQRKSWQKIPVSRLSAAAALAASAVVLALCLGYGTWRILAIDQYTASSPIKRIAVVQGNIDQAVKWQPAHQKNTLEKYFHLSKSAARKHTDLIVWPETAAPFYYRYDKALTNALNDSIARIGTAFLIGIPTVRIDKNQVAYYNTAILIGPDGRPQASYHKAHLVPFGEYVPLGKYLPFLGKMVAQVGDFTPGRVGDTIKWDSGALGSLICYELIFPYLARAQVKNGARLLVNLTNDAWYGRTSAPYQHFSMAVFRAIENRRFMVRAANTGISGFIDPVGRIMATTPLFEEVAISADVALLDQISCYTRFGDWFGQVCLALVLAGAIWQVARRRKTGFGRRPER